MDEAAAEHPAARYRAGDGVLFSSSKVPPGPGIENTCELPIGFIWTPLSPNNNMTTIQTNGETLLPVLCLTCLAYCNLFATFDLATGVWICPLCEAKNVAPTESFSLNGPLSPVLVSPALEFRQSFPNSCSHDLDVCNVVFVLDANLPCNEAQAVGSVARSILAEIADAPCQINLGLIVFGKDVSIYQLGVYGMASADVFANHTGLTEDHLNDRSYLMTVEKGDTDLDSLLRCISAVYGVAVSTENDENDNSGNSPAPVSRMDQLRQRKEERLRRQQASSSGGGGASSAEETHFSLAKSPWTMAKEKAKAATPRRCTGEAVQCAIDLATAGSSNEARTSRILLFTNGCPNFGDGTVVSSDVAVTSATNDSKSAPDAVDPPSLARAVQYFDIIARSASEAGVGIDVLCSGSLELALPAYQALVEPSAGYVLPHETFASAHLQHNLGYLLKHTFVSTAPLQDDANAATSSQNEVWMEGCVIDIRMSK